tara:strand:- start:157 stop:429 length:273 start_codon:yes stop_codon:yes gene_type:complete
MSKLINIRAYEYKELDDEAKARFIHEMYDMPFDYDDDDENGNTIRKYEYFADWDLEAQIEFCELNNYLFNRYGELIGHLEEVENKESEDE